MSISTASLLIRRGFSPWLPWSDRKSFRDARLGGVYLLAHFKRTPRGAADPLSPCIVYVGETRKQTFARRWTQFNLSASSGRLAHAGGSTYFARFKKLGGGLYVAALPVTGMKVRERSLFIRLYEYKLLCDYLEKHGRLPCCNFGPEALKF
jgi:hypothetical protein